MKCSDSHIGAEKVTIGNPEQLLLGQSGPFLIQLDAVAPAVMSEGQAQHRVPSSAAWVQQIDRLIRKSDAPLQIPYMRQIGGIMP